MAAAGLFTACGSSTQMTESGDEKENPLLTNALTANSIGYTVEDLSAAFYNNEKVRHEFLGYDFFLARMDTKSAQINNNREMIINFVLTEDFKIVVDPPTHMAYVDLREVTSATGIFTAAKIPQMEACSDWVRSQSLMGCPLQGTLTNINNNGRVSMKLETGLDAFSVPQFFNSLPNKQHYARIASNPGGSQYVLDNVTPTAVNDLGDAVGFRGFGTNRRAVSFNNLPDSELQKQETAPFNELTSSEEDSRALDIDNGGRIVGVKGDKAILWENGQEKVLGTGVARAANSDSGLIVGTKDGRPASWSDIGPSYLAPLNRTGHAFDVNVHGNVIGAYNNGDITDERELLLHGNERGFIYFHSWNFSYEGETVERDLRTSFFDINDYLDGGEEEYIVNRLISINDHGDILAIGQIYDDVEPRLLLLTPVAPTSPAPPLQGGRGGSGGGSSNCELDSELALTERCDQ